jgi:hypothetical protein
MLALANLLVAGWYFAFNSETSSPFDAAEFDAKLHASVERNLEKYGLDEAYRLAAEEVCVPAGVECFKSLVGTRK